MGISFYKPLEARVQGRLLGGVISGGARGAVPDGCKQTFGAVGVPLEQRGAGADDLDVRKLLPEAGCGIRPLSKEHEADRQNQAESLALQQFQGFGIPGGEDDFEPLRVEPAQCP